MNVSRKSWHYWVWKKVADGFETDVSVCEYWARVMTAPLLVLCLDIVLGVALPIIGVVLLARKLPWKWKAPACPLGRVKFY